MTNGFEAPIFKRLPKNDTGQAVGHQAGFVVPKELGPYFPPLPAATTSSPAPSVSIRAILVLDGVEIGTVDTVFQHQTWGATRPPERRVTANLRPLLGPAHEDDILTIERSLAEDSLYRFTLVRSGTSEYDEVERRTNGRRWGILAGTLAPATNDQIAEQVQSIVEQSDKPFSPFDEGATTTTVKRIARSRAFRALVKKAYGDQCAICGGGLINNIGVSEIEAAHIVSRRAKGTDDVRNGLALCRAHHWAFDQGMISVDGDRTILVRPALFGHPENASLKAIAGSLLRNPSDLRYVAHQDAFAWHRAHVFKVED